MNHTGCLPRRRRRRGYRARKRRTALAVGLILLLSVLLAVYHYAKKPDATAEAARIITTEYKKAVLRGVDWRTARALSDILILQLGKPYLYGADGPDAFDCSGFVQYVYAMLDIALPRVVRAQATAGTVIGRDDLCFGDLVFFSDGSVSLTHVAIYLGDGYFIHAPSTGERVQLGDLSWAHYDDAFRMAVRVLT